MEQLSNAASLIFGLAAWILPAAALVRHDKISGGKFAALTAASLGSCAVSLYLQLFYTDRSALPDPSHATALAVALLFAVTIVLNVIALLAYFGGNRKKSLIAEGRVVKGVVTATKTLDWLTVNKNAVRMNHDNSSHPHMVYFRYFVDGIDYEGKSYVSWKVPEFDVGQRIDVYVGRDDPKKYVFRC